MAPPDFPEKRTRSQLTIPDALLLQLSQGSPLKDARTALRHKITTCATLSPHPDEEIVDETDDELLLSPGKPIGTMRTTKRSVSPPPGDEYAFKPQSPSQGRELKRAKLDSDGAHMQNGHTINTSVHRSTHTRSLSQPVPGKSATRARSGTVWGSVVPNSLPTDTVVPMGTGKERAHSVPTMFPAGITHIDLRNPPESPRRTRSRSPSKQRELHIVTGPTAAKLEPIPDETESAMDVDEEAQIPPPQQATVSEADNPSIQTGPTENANPGRLMSSPSPSRKRPPPVLLPIIVEPPATPVGPPSPLSPLTPIPDTPLPTKGVKDTNRYIAPAWGTRIEEEEELHSTLSPKMSKPLPALTMVKSRLPRPSSSTNLLTLSVNPPQDVLDHKQRVASSSTKPVASASKPNDAFAVLMANAREGKDQSIKGKGKEKAAATKPVPFSIKSGSSSSKLVQKGKVADVGKAKEVPRAPKTSIKNKMKPKTMPKTRLKPTPVVPSPVLEIEKEHGPPPPSLPQSPLAEVPRLTSTRPASPNVSDVSMEGINIEPTIEADVSTEIASKMPASTPDISMPIDSSDHNHVINSHASEHAVEPIESGPPMLPGAPHTEDGDVLEPSAEIPLNFTAPVLPVEDEAPAPDSATGAAATAMETVAGSTSSAKPTSIDCPIKKTKLHMSKRIPSAAPTRITRSASLKRNERNSEIPKALPAKVVEKRVKKKSVPPPEPNSIFSGFSSKPDDENAMETTGSTSAEPDPTDVLQGSPVKLSSPAKKIVKTPKSSFAQPTKSAMSKQVSPSKPSLPKSRNASPNKLGRSASMTSRPRASLSRSLTSYSNLAGSSLSTLSSALEKLQARPPGRPSTSLGFNRDDPDSSIELEARSQDDSSIAPSTSSKPVISASQTAPRNSRLVQGTLTGARPSLGGKAMVGGSRTLMRGTGTGGFKVPGIPVKTRIFGVGGGAFAGATRARAVQKASRKTSLPSVMASPMKGGDNTDTDDPMDTTEDSAPPAYATSDESLPMDKGKGKERATEPWISDASRRFSMVSQALSQSLASSAKEFNGPGIMGPPATPKGRQMARSASSTYPSTSSVRPESPTRTSLRLAQNAESSRNKIVAEATAVPFKILKDCVVFVDVRNDDGDEVGGPFADMLEVSGAKILTRVGQTCTHIVFKNGLMSTINRYRLLRDPKPLVVGIAWVVECAEQRTKVDETKFLVDLDGINFSGGNKRRRSMIPKLISDDFEERLSSDVEGDVSMDGSTSSITLDDDLTPLEKARRRKLIAS